MTAAVSFAMALPLPVSLDIVFRVRVSHNDRRNFLRDVFASLKKFVGRVGGESGKTGQIVESSSYMAIIMSPRGVRVSVV